MNFKQSDKVVCICDSWDLTRFITMGDVPVKDRVYVVSGSIQDDNNHIGLVLVGCRVVHRGTGRDMGWDYQQFRKLEEVQAENRARVEREEALELRPLIT
jgi:hypothetical protein